MSSTSPSSPPAVAIAASIATATAAAAAVTVTVTVRIKYFASIREALGLGHEELSTTAPTLDALRAELIARGGAYAEALAPVRAVRMALNQALSDGTAALPPGAEVAFFPPVTGG